MNESIRVGSNILYCIGKFFIGYKHTRGYGWEEDNNFHLRELILLDRYRPTCSIGLEPFADKLLTAPPPTLVERRPDVNNLSARRRFHFAVFFVANFRSMTKKGHQEIEHFEN